MDVPTMEMHPAEAEARAEEYRKALRRRADEEYEQVLAGLERMAQGEAVLSLRDAMRSAVTADHLRSANACSDQVRVFRDAFPGGAHWPDDIPVALDHGLDVDWAQKELGLPPLIVEDVPERRQ